MPCSRDFSISSRISSVLRAAFLGVSIAALAGCSGYESLGERPIDPDFRFSTLNWTSGNVSVIALKAFPEDDNLAVCAAYTTGIGNFEMMVNRQYFDVATIHMGEERIGAMSFANAIRDTDVAWLTDSDSVASGLAALKANCVRTDHLWDTSYATEKIRISGPKRIKVYD